MAAAWLRKAADQGNSEAQHALGVLYDNGNGVPKDSPQAALWYRKAAEQGDVEAQHSLGSMYYVGEGVPQDYVKAHMWVKWPPLAHQTPRFARRWQCSGTMLPPR